MPSGSACGKERFDLFAKRTAYVLSTFRAGTSMAGIWTIPASAYLFWTRLSVGTREGQANRRSTSIGTGIARIFLPFAFMIRERTIGSRANRSLSGLSLGQSSGSFFMRSGCSPAYGKVGVAILKVLSHV